MIEIYEFLLLIFVIIIIIGIAIIIAPLIIWNYCKKIYNKIDDIHRIQKAQLDNQKKLYDEILKRLDK